MKANESAGEYAPGRQDSTDSRITDDEPDHDVPVAEQLTERQRELVGHDGGDGR